MPASQQIVAVLWGLGVGTALIVIIYATIRGGWYREPLVGSPRNEDSLPDPHPQAEDSMPAVQDSMPVVLGEVHDYPDDVSEAHGPVPLVVKIVTVSFVLWAIGYVVLFVQRGYTFT